MKRRTKPEGSTQAVYADTWDCREQQRATKGVRRYSSARKSLGKATSTGADALADVFYVLSKAAPRIVSSQEISPSHLVNRMVAAEMVGLPATRRLRGHTVGDPTQAVLGSISLAPTLEAVFERLALEQSRAQELADQAIDLKAMEAELAKVQADFDGRLGDDPSDETIEALLSEADRLRDQRQEVERQRRSFDAERQSLIDQLDDESPSVRSALRDAVGDLADTSADEAAASRAWGLSPADLRHLSANERLALAKKLKQDRMRQIADLFGRIRNLSLMDAHVVDDGAPQGIVDLELGGDLGRILPSELLMLNEPDTELDFLARWADGELLQYSVDTTNELGRGGIVMCVDGSGSMYGSAELWSKAVMLTLLHEARAQGRTMHVIHFGSPGHYKHMAFVEPSDFTAERIIDAAGAFFGGGTDFTTPMEVALSVLGKEFARYGRTRADVVFATDDECSVRPAFMEHYLSEMGRMRARTYGLEMRGRTPEPDGALATMCEGRVASISDLQSGRDIRTLLQAVR